MRAPRTCAFDGCPEVAADRGYCPAHRRTSPRSPSSTVTGTNRWRSLKRRLLKPGDACHYCGREAVTLDHVLPVSQRPDLAYEPTNLVPSCEPCNLRKGGRLA
jgi:5-methylcytosine-specific restriction endonuclease McrA